MPRVHRRTCVFDIPLTVIGDESWTLDEKYEHADHLADLASSALSMSDAAITRTSVYPNRRESDPHRHPRIVAWWSWLDGSDPHGHEAAFVDRMVDRLTFLFDYAKVRYWVDGSDEPLVNTDADHFAAHLDLAG